MPTALAAFLFLFMFAPVQEDQRLDTAAKEAQRAADATVKADVETLADLTHPKIIELAGGRDRMIEAVRKGMESMKAQGIAIRSAEVAKPERIVEGEGALYCLIPQTVVLDVEGGTLTSRSHVIGVSRDSGKTWRFIDVAPGAAKTREMFPEIPKDLKIPERQPPKFEPKAKDRR
jgi:hypothetical protein